MSNVSPEIRVMKGSLEKLSRFDNHYPHTILLKPCAPHENGIKSERRIRRKSLSGGENGNSGGAEDVPEKVPCENSGESGFVFKFQVLCIAVLSLFPFYKVLNPSRVSWMQSESMVNMVKQ